MPNNDGFIVEILRYCVGLQFDREEKFVLCAGFSFLKWKMSISYIIAQAHS